MDSICRFLPAVAEAIEVLVAAIHGGIMRQVADLDVPVPRRIGTYILKSDCQAVCLVRVVA